MKCLLESTLAETIRTWAKECIADSQPLLCCQVEEADASSATTAVISLLKRWKDPLYLVGQLIDDKYVSSIIDVVDLQKMIADSWPGDDVLSFMGLSSKGGCTIDITLNDNDVTEILLDTWGDKEAMAEELASMFHNSHVFRGN